MTGRGFGFEAKPGSDEWYSPPGLFDSMGVRFDLDPCGVPNTPAAAHCASMYVHPHQDGLLLPWGGSVWINPPYSEMRLWVEKWLVEKTPGVMVCYARTDTGWAQRLLANVDRVLFLRRRVRFLPGAGQQVSSPGAPSMLCGMGPIGRLALANMAGHGVLVTP